MKKKSLLVGMAALLFPLTMSAQYTIYPIPHEQTAGTGKVSFTQTVNVVCDNGIDAATKKRVTDIFAQHDITAAFSDVADATQSNIYLGINGAEGSGNAMATQLGLSLDVLTKAKKYDRHILSLTDGGNGVAQLLVLGENTDATFYGLASLEQILDNGTTDLETVTLNDYADLKERGIIEGFYGKPYAKDVRNDLLRFMMRYKMNTYVYGAKSDPYHSGSWSTPYPTSAQLSDKQKASGFVSSEDMQDFASVASDTKVNVAWAIHPGNSLLNSSTVITDIMSKFTSMYKLGFRQFAVFCDDVSVPSTQDDMNLTASRITQLQRAIEAKWNTPGADPADTVKALRFTPQIYCRAFAGPDTQYNNFFQALSTMPSNVTVYYTGYGVWSVPNDGDLNQVQNQFGREVIWWWNYPCNDNGTGPNEIYPMDMKSNFYDMPNVNNNASLPSEITASSQGIICNPMEQGEASKTAVFSAGDFGWNNKAFNNAQSWEASFKGLFPGNEAAQKAYRFLAPYLSKNDPDALNTLIKNYKTNGDATQLQALMKEIMSNCDVMASLENSTVDGERLLYKDVKPWVVRLHDLAAYADTLLDVASSAVDSSVSEVIEQSWINYMNMSKAVPTLSTKSDYMTHHMSGFGSDYINTDERLTHAAYRYLTPFVEDYLTKNATNWMFNVSDEPQVITNVDNLMKPQASYSGASVYVKLGRASNIPAGGYVGFELPYGKRVKDATVAEDFVTGEKFRAMVSENGKDWKLYNKDEVVGTRIRHFVVQNITNETQSLKLAASQTTFTFESAAEITDGSVPSNSGFYNDHTANYMYDGDYSTYTCIKQDQKLGDTYQVTLKEETPIESVRICMGTTNGDNVNEGVVQVSNDNKTWSDLTVVGTNTTTYTITSGASQRVATVDNNDVIATDFIYYNPTTGEAEAINAKYVRLKVTKLPSSNKWLRLHEIEVNGKAINNQGSLSDDKGLYLSNATDGDGTTSTGYYARSTSEGGEFIYHFNKCLYVEGVTLFCDPETTSGISYAVTLDGDTWQDVEANGEGKGVVKISLNADQQAAKALRIKWTGEKPIAIYEVSETNTDERPVVSKVESITADNVSSAEATLSYNGNSLVAQAPLGLKSAEVYTLDGAKVMSETLGGATEAILPIASAHQTFVVKLTLNNGMSKTFKVVK